MATEHTYLHQYLARQNKLEQLSQITEQLGQSGSDWVDRNLNRDTALARATSARKIVDFLLSGRDNLHHTYHPKNGDIVGLVRSTGKFEPVVYLRSEGNNALFKTLEEARLAKRKKRDLNMELPLYKAKFFFFRLELTEIPNDMLNLSDESEEDTDEPELVDLGDPSAPGDSDLDRPDT